MLGWSVSVLGISVLESGPVAQLGARLNGIQEVTGSIPVRSTIFLTFAFLTCAVIPPS